MLKIMQHTHTPLHLYSTLAQNLLESETVSIRIHKSWLHTNTSKLRHPVPHTSLCPIVLPYLWPWLFKFCSWDKYLNLWILRIAQFIKSTYYYNCTQYRQNKTDTLGGYRAVLPIKQIVTIEDTNDWSNEELALKV